MPSKLFGSQRPDKAHLVSGKGGVAGEVDDLRSDIEAAFLSQEQNGGLLRTDEFTDPAAADVDAIKLSISSETTAQQYLAADLDGVVGAGEMVPPRNITITSTVSADIDAVGVVITGLVRDETGTLVDQTETITLTDGGGVTDAGSKPFSQVTQIDVPAQSGTGGALEFGFGDIIGLSELMVSQAGLLAPIREIEAGTVVTTGTFTNESSSPVTSYAPATVPDGANDYAVTYIY